MDPKTVPPNAFLFIGAPSVFPTQKRATLDGVYVASHPSLGRAPFGVLTSEVQLLVANFRPRTENIPTRVLGIFAVFDSISRMSEAAHGVITDFSVTTSFSYKIDPSLDLISKIGFVSTLSPCLLSCV